MNQLPPFHSPATGFPAQEAYLAIELKPLDKAEKQRLEQLRRYVQAHVHQVDLRDLAPAVRELMGAGYQVGSGSSHVWIKRLTDDPEPAAPERLAIVADRLTTAFRDWYEPKLPSGPRLSIRPEEGLPIAGQHHMTGNTVTR
ncbi:hypothetical protein F1C16_21955 (plasmid) [Hymenobacter sp. NBH84]|uniref:hypothetical protein n=1 Tax=Hymenobacter sp. NBH84 TaxID=2596915 RepID=UPI0016273E6E|nr:hypothetical protein [Hymenobacter sp. NBH84]QNE42292.1 hypothetical protein F1C16_21955 [Hymenobacter sp. NBH84]